MKRFHPENIFIFIASAIWVISSICGCGKKEPEKLQETQEFLEEVGVAEITKASKDAEQDIKLSGLGEEQKILSFDMTGYSNDGKKKWSIQGKSADIISDTVMLNDIEANAYSGDRTVVLKAQSGSYDKEKHSVRLEDNVVVTTSDGVTLSAEWLKWESETDTIKTDSFVEVEKDNLYASGNGASANTKQKDVQLNNNILVRQDDVNVSCDGPLTIDYGNNKASFYGNVKVTEPRGELTADRLDIFFNPDSRKIEQIVAERNVELKQGQNTAKGQKIVYILASGEAILTGNPEILIYSKKELKDAFTGN